MTPEEFIERLRESISRKEGFSISVHVEGTWPYFEIASPLENTATISGCYCDSGDSFIRVSFSAREEFTRGEQSAARFLELVQEVTHVVGNQGCAEQQWITAKGEVRKSVIDLQLPRRGTYRLGKSPKFWQRNLRLVRKDFFPLMRMEDA